MVVRKRTCNSWTGLKSSLRIPVHLDPVVGSEKQAGKRSSRQSNAAKQLIMYRQGKYPGNMIHTKQFGYRQKVAQATQPG